jgi:hypothetical protein
MNIYIYLDRNQPPLILGPSKRTPIHTQQRSVTVVSTLGKTQQIRSQRISPFPTDLSLLHTFFACFNVMSVLACLEQPPPLRPRHVDEGQSKSSSKRFVEGPPANTHRQGTPASSLCFNVRLPVSNLERERGGGRERDDVRSGQEETSKSGVGLDVYKTIFDWTIFGLYVWGTNVSSWVLDIH